MSEKSLNPKNGIYSRSQPSILKSRKRKHSENDADSVKMKKENLEMPTSSSVKPLEDVTSSSLNSEREAKLTQDQIPEDWQRFRSFTCYPTPQPKRNVPLPNLSWANREQVWESMCRRERLYKINPNYLKKHPALQSRMRAILLDWLTEVCEVYKLHRETYYLATSFIDQYLSLTENIPKQQLQLIGITSLFIAAKIEEIYPPKLSEFSFVTDGACLDEEILMKELIILKTLNWDLSPVTSNSWLNTYLQLHYDAMERRAIVSDSNTQEIDDSFIFPKYSGLTFVQVARLLDFCSLDFSSLNFSASKLAASALSFTTSLPLSCLVSGYTSEDLTECRNWMFPLAIGVQEMGTAPLKSFSLVSADDNHNIQTHAVTLDALDRALVRRSQHEEMRSSPPTSQLQSPPDMLTPPKTDEKAK